MSDTTLTRYRDAKFRRVVQEVFNFLHYAQPTKPRSVLHLYVLTRLACSRNALSTYAAEKRLGTSGAGISNAQLRADLGDGMDDSYSIGPDAINFLERRVQATRPQTILEFGSGLSTVALARLMVELHGERDGPYVFTIDENVAYLKETALQLQALGLHGCVSLAHRPVVPQRVASRETHCYDLPHEFLRTFLVKRPDLVFVDGPSGNGDRRYGTLPLVREYLSARAEFLLDDALRDDEIAVARAWQKFPDFSVDGVYVVGHGILAGSCGKRTRR